MVIRSRGSEARLLGSHSCLYHFLVTWPWMWCLLSRYLGFLTHQTVIARVKWINISKAIKGIKVKQVIQKSHFRPFILPIISFPSAIETGVTADASCLWTLRLPDLRLWGLRYQDTYYSATHIRCKIFVQSHLISKSHWIKSWRQENYNSNQSHFWYERDFRKHAN